MMPPWGPWPMPVVELSLHTHIHASVRARARTHTHTHTHTDTHTHTHTHTFCKRIFLVTMPVVGLFPALSEPFLPTNTHTHTYRQTHSDRQTHTHTNARARAHSRVILRCACVPTCVSECARMLLLCVHTGKLSLHYPLLPILHPAPPPYPLTPASPSPLLPSLSLSISPPRSFLAVCDSCVTDLTK